MRMGLDMSQQTHPGQKATILREPHRPYGAGLGKHDRFIGVQNYKKNSPLHYFFSDEKKGLKLQMTNRLPTINQLFK